MADSFLNLARRVITIASAHLLVLHLAFDACAHAASVQDQIATCRACHGDSGQAASPDIPSIGGQPKLFVMYQLFFYREGKRRSSEMNEIAKMMSDADLFAIADYVSALSPPGPAGGPVDQALYRRGEELARERLCANCHNPDYSGRDQMPRLAYQREQYLLAAFKAYQSGARVGTQAAMAEALRGIDETGLASLAHYLAHFRP